jgi:hypothetical protein
VYVDRELGVGGAAAAGGRGPYGFYSSASGGLFMNISTGGGTLVHEIVHPYVEADFPSAPPWLNEGLGSLFEQSAIARDALPSFRELTAKGSAAFYDDERGTNHAQSRYLLYYLQELGLLRDFYRAFRAARAKDPTGYATLVQILGERDMAAFQRRWEQYVAALRFPEPDRRAAAPRPTPRRETTTR